MKLGATHCFVVHGTDGLDEITITGTTKVSEGKNGKVKTYTVKPSDFGLKRAKQVDLRRQCRRECQNNNGSAIR